MYYMDVFLTVTCFWRDIVDCLVLKVIFCCLSFKNNRQGTVSLLSDGWLRLVRI